MQKGLWITYGVLVVGSNLLVGLGIIMSDSHPLLILTLLPSTLICISALYGYLTGTPLMNRKIWRFLLWWVVLGVMVNSGKMVIANSSLEALDLLISVVLGIPLIYLIHRYSNLDNKIWGNGIVAKHAQEIVSLLSAHRAVGAQIKSETSEGTNEMSVHISKADNSFTIKLKKNVLGNAQAFKNEFEDPYDLVEFLNDNSIFTVPDLKPA